MLCTFKELPSNRWRFLSHSAGILEASFGSGHGVKMRAPDFGAGQDGIAPKGESAIKRCPKCNRRLHLRAVYDSPRSEFSHWQIPEHKVRETRKKSPKRKERKQRRGA